MNLRGLSLKMATLAFPLVLGASGCHTYKYFDVNVRFDEATLDDTDILQISRCRILVSGEDTDNFILARCPNAAASDPHDGVIPVTSPDGYRFEYSSFADSGTLTFELQGFVGLIDSPQCMIANGKAPIAVSGLTTIPGTLTATKNAAYSTTCLNVTPPTDGGN